MFQFHVKSYHRETMINYIDLLTLYFLTSELFLIRNTLFSLQAQTTLRSLGSLCMHRNFHIFSFDYCPGSNR